MTSSYFRFKERNIQQHENFLAIDRIANSSGVESFILIVSRCNICATNASTINYSDMRIQTLERLIKLHSILRVILPSTERVRSISRKSPTTFINFVETFETINQSIMLVVDSMSLYVYTLNSPLRNQNADSNVKCVEKNS